MCPILVNCVGVVSSSNDISDTALPISIRCCHHVKSCSFSFRFLHRPKLGSVHKYFGGGGQVGASDIKNKNKNKTNKQTKIPPKRRFKFV